MKQWTLMFVLSLLMLLTSCSTESEDNNSLGEAVPEPPLVNGNNGQVDFEETLTPDLDRNGDDVEFVIFENQWLKLQYDKSFQVEEHDDEVVFTDDEKDISFRVKLEQEPVEVKENILPAWKEEGYELFGEYTVADGDGEGYILQAYDYFEHNRDNLEIYVFNEEEYTLYIECHMPYLEEEDFVPRLDYMLDTVELNAYSTRRG